VIYGGSGKIASAVATAFAREGARIFLAGRTLAKLERVAERLQSTGATVDAAELDALNEQAVDAHTQAVIATAGSLDISFNLISHPYVQGTPVIEMNGEDYIVPIESVVRTTFLTWRAAARQMTRQRSGVILAFGGAADPPRGHYLGSLQVALHAVEAMRRQLATEIGSSGVRVVTLRTGGIPESIPPEFGGRDAVVEGIERATLLGRAATLEDVGNAAAFAASDRARTITGAVLDISSGTFMQ
jgi:NAD(P)-dependent dehydrogenase (short-subunit alcohol dehydrogenase family)